MKTFRFALVCFLVACFCTAIALASDPSSDPPSSPPITMAMFDGGIQADETSPFSESVSQPQYEDVYEQVCDGFGCRMVFVGRRLVGAAANTTRAAARTAADVMLGTAAVTRGVIVNVATPFNGCGCGCGCQNCNCGMQAAPLFSQMPVFSRTGNCVPAEQSILERSRTNRQLRRNGRRQNLFHFSQSGQNVRMLNLARFFPRAWFTI